MDRCFVCYYHEITLKKNNRSFFEAALYRNAQQALKGIPYRRIRRLSGRLLVELEVDSPLEEVGSRLQKVFGLVSCCPSWSSGQDVETLQADLWYLVSQQDFETFKIHTKRANKKYPMTSPEVNALLGDFVRRKSKKTVQLKAPDLTCYVDIVEKYAFLYFSRLEGAKGLPISSSGKVVVLISGGIDSPVAAYKVMKRGCRAVFVHFHSLPHTTRESLEKVRQLVAVFNQYQFRSKLYMIPFAELQRQIVAYTPVRTRVIMYRRLMMRLAERIAHRERAHALVTGDSIGQVASQTLENIRVISDACSMPILRPLVGEDKEEIIAVARRIETFPISILPEEDCCSLFVPRHPETRAKLDGIRRVESSLNIEQMVEDALKGIQIETIQSQSPSAAEVVKN